MYCKYCKTENDIDAKFCSSCGQAIHQSENMQKKNGTSHFKILTIIILLVVIATIAVLIIISKSSSNGNTFNLIPSIDDKKNHQVVATTLLDREVPTNSYGLFSYSFSNGSEYLDKVYMFKNNPSELTGGENSIDDYENNFTMKLLFLYEDGNKDYTLQVQEYYRENSGDEPSYDNQYYFVRDFEDRQRIGAYHSYEIGTSGTVYDNNYLSFSYDETGNLTETSDDLGDKNYYYYDEYGVLSEKYYDNENTTYTYEKDGYGNIINVTKYKGEKKKRYCEYEYDLNNITKESYYFFNSDGEQQLLKTTLYTYDENENITNISVEKYSEYTGEYRDTETTTYYYNNNKNVVKVIISDKYSINYMLFEYTDSPTPYYNEN